MVKTIDFETYILISVCPHFALFIFLL